MKYLTFIAILFIAACSARSAEPPEPVVGYQQVADTLAQVTSPPSIGYKQHGSGNREMVSCVARLTINDERFYLVALQREEQLGMCGALRPGDEIAVFEKTINGILTGEWYWRFGDYTHYVTPIYRTL